MVLMAEFVYSGGLSLPAMTSVPAVPTTEQKVSEFLGLSNGEINLCLNADPGKDVKKQDKKDQVIPT